MHPLPVELRRSELAFLHPGQGAEIVVGDAACGWVGALHPQLTRKFGFNRSPIVLEMDVAPLLRRKLPGYQDIPRVPAVRRDIAVIVEANVTLADMMASVKKAALPLLAEINCFDVYQGQGVGSNKKSLAFNMLLQHTEKTLTDSEIDSTVAEVVNILAKNHNAILRS